MDTLHQVLLHLRAKRWNAAHGLVQHDHSTLGAWLHGILHIQEGDLEDAEYWYGKTTRPPGPPRNTRAPRRRATAA